MSYEDDWELSSGFALDGAEVEITEASFGTNAKISATAACLNLVLTPIEGGDDMDQSFSVGGDWESNAHGTALQHVRNNAKISNMSNYGLLLASVMEVLNEEGLNPGDIIGSPKEAEGWVGTRWTFGTKSRDVVNPTTGEAKAGSKFIVTAYLGKSDDDDEATEAEAPKPTAKKATTKKAPAKKAAAPKGIPAGVDPEAWERTVQVALTYIADEKEYEDFVADILDDEEVAKSQPLRKACMGTKPGSVWATALAR